MVLVQQLCICNFPRSKDMILTVGMSVDNVGYAVSPLEGPIGNVSTISSAGCGVRTASTGHKTSCLGCCISSGTIVVTSLSSSDGRQHWGR
jgi:hypothetical protein